MADDDTMKTYYGSIDVEVLASSDDDAHDKIREAIMSIVFDHEQFEESLSIDVEVDGDSDDDDEDEEDEEVSYDDDDDVL
jgi:hypothetical protein